jgi:predicted DNA-binding mobile mystery protein A
MRSSPTDRSLLDRRFSGWRSPGPPPPSGWIRAIREALGMPRDELARRLRITKQGVAKLESSEADGTIGLDTLRRAAEALDCTLVYALVPRTSLETIVEERAREVARREVTEVEHTMVLEDQRPATADSERLVDELAERLKESARLWRE